MNDPNNEIVWNGLAARFGQNFVMKNGKYNEVFTSYTLIVISNKLPSIGKHTDDGIPIPYGDYVVDSNGIKQYEIADVIWMHMNSIASDEVKLTHGHFGLPGITIVTEIIQHCHINKPNHYDEFKTAAGKLYNYAMSFY